MVFFFGEQLKYSFFGAAIFKLAPIKVYDVLLGHFFRLFIYFLGFFDPVIRHLLEYLGYIGHISTELLKLVKF